MGLSSVNADLFYCSVINVGEQQMWLYNDIDLMEGKV